VQLQQLQHEQLRHQLAADGGSSDSSNGNYIISLPNCQENQPCQWIKSSTPLNVVNRLIEAQKDSGLFSTQQAPSDPLPVWDQDGIRERNNCYNFAVNTITNTFAQPGQGTNQLTTDYSKCDALVESAKKDGLQPVTKDQVGDYSGPNVSCRYVALTIAGPQGNISDFHWFRLMRTEVEDTFNKDKKEVWYHKPGSNYVMKTDFNGKTIPKNGLEESNRGPYDIMCGYFKHCVLVQ